VRALVLCAALVHVARVSGDDGALDGLRHAGRGLKTTPRPEDDAAVATAAAIAAAAAVAAQAAAAAAQPAAAAGQHAH
jgi:hypothetical protein